MAAEDDMPTIQIDQKSFDYWRGQVDTVLSDISRKMDGVTISLQGLNEWRAAIAGRIDHLDQRLQIHEQVISEQASAIKQLTETLQKIAGTVEQISATQTALMSKTDDAKAEPDIEKQAPTYRTIVERVVIPLLVTIVTYILLTMIPNIGKP